MTLDILKILLKHSEYMEKTVHLEDLGAMVKDIENYVLEKIRETKSKYDPEERP